MAKHGLHLRTEKCFDEFANKVSLLLWERLREERGVPRLDFHRFPTMTQVVNAVLQRHIGVCDLCADLPYCDEWGRMRERREAGFSCKDHERQLLADAGTELDKLLRDLEAEAMGFISRHDPSRARVDAFLPDMIHRAIREAVAPYLYQNIAGPCCAESPTEEALC